MDKCTSIMSGPFMGVGVDTCTLCFSGLKTREGIYRRTLFLLAEFPFPFNVKYRRKHFQIIFVNRNGSCILWTRNVNRCKIFYLNIYLYQSVIKVLY
jgi:hypothetical protein